jgi:ATP-dependent Lon protease
MSLSNVDLELPENFSGIVRLFPLPNLVLFPGVVQALHIFEPRYRKLMQDALSGDQTISICLVKDAGNPTTQFSPTDEPEIHQVICIGKIVAHTRLADGRYNLLLMGVCRARIIRELPVEQPYRMAEVKLLVDKQPIDATAKELRTRVIRCCRELHSNSKLLEQESIHSILMNDLPLGRLIDLLSFSVTSPCEDRQLILETSDVAERGELLLKLVEQRLALQSQDSQIDFPPDFSSN